LPDLNCKEKLLAIMLWKDFYEYSMGKKTFVCGIFYEKNDYCIVEWLFAER